MNTNVPERNYETGESGAIEVGARRGENEREAGEETVDRAR